MITIDEALSTYKMNSPMYLDIAITKEFFNLNILQTNIWSTSRMINEIPDQENSIRDFVWDYAISMLWYS